MGQPSIVFGLLTIIGIITILWAGIRLVIRGLDHVFGVRPPPKSVDLIDQTSGEVRVTCPVCGAVVVAIWDEGSTITDYKTAWHATNKKAGKNDAFVSPGALYLRLRGEGEPIPCRACTADLTAQWLATDWFKRIQMLDRRDAENKAKAASYNEALAEQLKRDADRKERT